MLTLSNLVELDEVDRWRRVVGDAGVSVGDSEFE
jgi:hypothetical protein